MKKGLKMANGLSADLRVKRRVRDGWYIYTCDELPGLFVAGHDDRVAYEDVADSIRSLLRLEHSVNCVVTHKVDYQEFIRNLDLTERAKEAVTRRTAMLMADTAFLSFSVAKVPSDGPTA